MGAVRRERVHGAVAGRGPRPQGAAVDRSEGGRLILQFRDEAGGQARHEFIDAQAAAVELGEEFGGEAVDLVVDGLVVGFGFLGADSEIDVLTPGGGAHKSEFEDWGWRPFAELSGLIVPFKRPVYEAVVESFAPLSRWQAGA